jgi:HK97 family phage major capsid protein
VNYSTDGILTIFGRPGRSKSSTPRASARWATSRCVDLSKYRLIRKGGVEQASSMHVYFSTGEQAFRAFYRVDGQPVPRAALTPFKGSRDAVPFVVLQPVRNRRHRHAFQ